MLRYSTAAGRRVGPRLAAVLVLAGCVLTAGALGGAPAQAASSAVSPMAAPSSGTVRATALPTVQIDGIVWTQVVVGDTVYAGGRFSTARPAGAAPNTRTVPRSNLLAYSLSTGRLITSFAPTFNGQVLALAVSPDRSTLYVGGEFTTVNGADRGRIAAFDVASGGLLAGFHPKLNAAVEALAASSSAVYAGGTFTVAAGSNRSRLAAFSPASGALLGWKPSADSTVNALLLTPDGTHVVVAGHLYTLNGTPVYGLGAVDATTGAVTDFAADRTVQAWGTGAAFLSLATDGRAVYAGAFNYHGNGGFEGTVSADPDTGAVNWIEDCHGDTYGVFASSSNLYVAGHPHFCANIGGFPDVTNARAHHGLAFTTNATGTVQHNTDPNHPDFYGQPSPSLVVWLPAFSTGDVSGEDQATWSVTGNDRYVAMGGEFPTVNGKAQEGLVRFAVAGAGPDISGPVLHDSAWVPTVQSAGFDAERVSIGGNWDRDDLSLTYTLLRDTGAGTAVTTVTSDTADSLLWAEPSLSASDYGLNHGTTYRYAVSATDAAGNTALSSWVSVTP